MSWFELRNHDSGSTTIFVRTELLLRNDFKTNMPVLFFLLVSHGFDKVFLFVLSVSCSINILNSKSSCLGASKFLNLPCKFTSGSIVVALWAMQKQVNFYHILFQNKVLKS